MIQQEIKFHGFSKNTIQNTYYTVCPMDISKYLNCLTNTEEKLKAPKRHQPVSAAKVNFWKAFKESDSLFKQVRVVPQGLSPSYC